MNWLVELYSHHFLTFTFVLARVTGLVLTAPLCTSIQAPKQVRAVLALALALVITPTQIELAPTPPQTLAALSLPLANELIVGASLGLGVSILLGAAQISGHLIAQLSGLSAAQAFDPGMGGSVPVFSRLLGLFATAIYLIVGAHRWLIGALLETYRVIPAGAAKLSESLGETLLAILSQSFSLGVRGAAPVVLALMLATLILGLIGRTLPQLNVLALGFGLNALVTFGVLMISLGTIAWLFEAELQPAISALFEAIVKSAPAA
ncbi:MAG TPA: flagellar biosynthetic protein FliR [Pirellulales bacterium]|jgi:flagellar biosynthetic protein FliR